MAPSGAAAPGRARQPRESPGHVHGLQAVVIGLGGDASRQAPATGARRPQAGPVPVSCSLAPASARRARTSPMAGSWLAGSGSGRCAWIW